MFLFGGIKQRWLKGTLSAEAHFSNIGIITYTHIIRTSISGDYLFYLTIEEQIWESGIESFLRSNIYYMWTHPQTRPCTLKPLSHTQTHTPPSVPLSFPHSDSFPLNPFSNWLCGRTSIKIVAAEDRITEYSATPLAGWEIYSLRNMSSDSCCSV